MDGYSHFVCDNETIRLRPVEVLHEAQFEYYILLNKFDRNSNLVIDWSI